MTAEVESIRFRACGAEPVPVAPRDGPRAGEDLRAYVERIACSAGVTWERATVVFKDGARSEVSRE